MRFTELTTAVVVQARGRGLRLDPAHPQKVATTWSVVCVDDAHPGGDADWKRLVRKHSGFAAVDLDSVDEDGLAEVVDGIAHLDATLSAFTPSGPVERDALNARMVARAQDRPAIHRAWGVGLPHADQGVASLRITSRSRQSRKPGVLVRAGRLEAPGAHPWRPGALQTGLVVAGGTVAAGLASWAGATLLVTFLVATVVLGVGVVLPAASRARRLLRGAGQAPGVDLIGCALADAMHEARLSPAGAGSVRVRLVGDEYRAQLEGIDEHTSRVFVEALDELLAPVGDPRYLVPRWVFDDAGPLDAVLALVGRARPTGQAWHAVPTVFGRRRGDADLFARHLDRLVGAGQPVSTRSPEGEGALVASRGQDPLAVTTVVRTAWH